MTCIKWIPNSTHLFLVSHSSGNMYLYNINLVSNSASLTSNNNTANTNSNNQVNQNNINNTTNNSQQQQQQQLPSYQLTFTGDGYSVYTNQLSSNPVSKWSITGFNESSSSNNQIFGINEFSFSPCAQYLACACQDGYLRVFNYRDMGLKSLMKSYFGGLLCCCWSHDGKYIATGGEDDLITIYSFYENRVACRGRGHCSWINSVQFDYWSSSSNDQSYLGSSDINDENGDSDLEDYYHQSNNNSNSNSNKVNKLKTSIQKQQSIRTSKRMSSVSDYEQQVFSTNKNIYYRLASVGQDNQIAFWDLTEDVLKEKTHSRSRVTSLAQTNCVNQTTVSTINAAFTTITSISTQLSSSSSSTIDNRKSPSPTNTLLHSTDQQIILNPATAAAAASSSSTSSGSSGFFFKKHKRYSSLNSNKSHKSNQLSLLTAKKGNYTVSPATSTLDSQAASALNSKLSKLNLNQLCPKLDEVPIIEPLICKRISHERLTSLIFKEECFLTACQDGIIYTWARPGGKVSLTNI